jgi:hypothetical protein
MLSMAGGMVDEGGGGRTQCGSLWLDPSYLFPRPLPDQEGVCVPALLSLVSLFPSVPVLLCCPLLWLLFPCCLCRAPAAVMVH